MSSREPLESESSFHASLAAALSSRASRRILRRLPVPSDPVLSSFSDENENDDDGCPPKLVTPSPTFAPTRASSTTKTNINTATATNTHPNNTHPHLPPPLDFSTNDYLSLSTSTHLRTHFLHTLHRTPHILGSGGSRLLVNPSAHDKLEKRLAKFFRAESALLWNSGFDGNVGVFGCLPRGIRGGGEGDWIVFDEYVHASVWDGMRAWEARNAERGSGEVNTRRCLPFTHNSLDSLRRVLCSLLESEAGVREGRSAVFVAVESLYSMDGTVAPLSGIVAMLEELFGEGVGVGGEEGGRGRRRREAYVIVDEAHATGIYGPQGRGMVAREGLEDER